MNAPRWLAVLWLYLIPLGPPAHVGGPIHPDGSEVQIDLPRERHQGNRAGVDGAGLCVFTSIAMAADWAHELALVDFAEYMTRYPGGGYPQKVTECITRRCRELNQPEPPYLQIQGNDLELIALAVERGHMACVTYGLSPTGRYNGRRIAHMVNVVAARAGPERHWAILDNNFPGSIEWMSEAAFHQAYTALGEGWAVILLAPGPPPCPFNGPH